MNILYTDDLWNAYVEKVEDDFKLKTYPQLDTYFHFQEENHRIKELVSDPTLHAIKTHGFLPFLKIITRTPRYRYQAKKKKYGLETKKRPISFASHFDTYIYGFYSFVLNKK